jgi:hypothetical protein
MGKASSSKKVARAAGLGGGRAYAKRPAWGYYFGVFVLLLLGVVGVYNAREYRDNQINSNGSGNPTTSMTSPWFEAYAIDECGKILPPIKTSKDPYGITTKGNGVITIKPTVKSAAGHNATLGKFASSIGMTLNAGEIETPGGRLYQDGASCEGKPGHVYVMTWTSPAEPDQEGTLQSSKGLPNSNGTPNATGLEDTCSPDCDSGVLLEDEQLVTIAFVPAFPKHRAPSLPQPPASVIAALDHLESTGGTTTTAAPVTSAPAVTPTTAPSTAKSAPTGTTSVSTGSTTKPKTATTSKTTTT